MDRIANQKMLNLYRDLGRESLLENASITFCKFEKRRILVTCISVFADNGAF